MAWAGGTFSRVYGTTGWQDDAAAAIGIQADLHDTNDGDLANGINACLTKDGSNQPTANLPMGGNKHTGVANASANNEYMAYGQIRNGAPLYMDTANLRLGVNSSTPVAALDVNTLDTPAVLARFGADTTGSTLFFRKSRGTSIGTNTIVQNGDTLGIIDFRGANGTGFSPGATIRAEVDAAPGATNDMPAKVVIATSPNGTASPVDRFTITNAGEVAVGVSAPASNYRFSVRGVNTGTDPALYVDNSAIAKLFAVFNNGQIDTGLAASSPYNNITGSAANVFVSSGGILQRSTSSQKYKTDIQDATHGLQEVMALRPVTYKGLNDGEQVFGGLIAEEVHAAGLTEFVQYGPDGTPDALAYGNMVSLAFKAIQQLAARVEALEAQLAE